MKGEKGVTIIRVIDFAIKSFLFVSNDGGNIKTAAHFIYYIF